MSRTLIGLFLFASIFSLDVFGFSNAYLSFEQPEGWTCELVQKAWICQSENPAEKKEALVMSIAALATDWDAIENYEEYLKSPKPIGGEHNDPVLHSEVSYARKRNINGHIWVDALHHNSELPGFWTRYTVTVHETPKVKLAILVTYVVSDERRTQFAPQFERMVSSLKPNAEFDLNAATKQGDVPLLGSDRLGSIQGKIIADRLRSPKPSATPTPGPSGSGGDNSGSLALILFGAAAVIAVVILRRRRAAAAKALPKEPTQ